MPDLPAIKTVAEIHNIEHDVSAGTKKVVIVNGTGEGTADAQTIVFLISSYIPGGLRLGRGTTDKLRAVVRDDLTGLDEFTVRVLGYKHYPR